MLLPIHVAAGGLAIILGALALSAKKGGTLHRRTGILFVYAMLTMGISASILAFRKSPTNPNVFAALMTIYFVGTALTAVRPVTRWSRRFDLAALTVVIALATADIVGGVKALNSPRGLLNGIPFGMFFFLATIKTLAAAGDVRVLRWGGAAGGQRLARHLWRMCFALFIAVGSFFSIRERVARILPEPFTTPTMRLLPMLLVFAAMFYWLWRVRRRTWKPLVDRARQTRKDNYAPHEPGRLRTTL
ncbi:MAG TPA: DUF2306 domain-containing protein [Tepidisphaeraceae bacterium]|nr:DUF2306 domain-containing protein [Tepidisphaeraceae bacterium]